MSCPRHLRSLARSVTSGAATAAHTTYPQAGVITDVTPSLAQVAKCDTAPRPFKDIPGPRGVYQWPFIGTVLLYKPFTRFTASTTPELFEHMFNKFGPIVRLQLQAPCVLIHEPEDLEQLFANEGKYPRRPSFGLTRTYNRRNGIKDALGDMEGEDWQRLRSPLNRHLLKVDSASHYLAAQGQVADEFATAITSHSGKAEELRDWFFRYATECIGLVCFNTRLGLMNADVPVEPDALRFVEETKNVFAQIQNVLSGKSLMHNYYLNKTYREYAKSNTFLRRYANAKLRRAQEALRKQNKEEMSGLNERNLLAALMAEKDLDFEDVENMMTTLYVAGMESTAKNLQTLFHTLAVNPDKQDKLYREVLDVVGEDGPVTSESFGRMPYLKACVKESFRLKYPTMTGPVRILQSDAIIRGYSVPAGVQVMPCNHYTCKTLFSDSDKFIPERWVRSDGNRKLPQDIPPLACLPFGYGPRNCIGRRFAEQEMYLAIIKTLQRASIELVPESKDVSFTYTIFIEPADAIEFQFTPRENCRQNIGLSSVDADTARI